MSFIFMHKREERAEWKCHCVTPMVTESTGTLMLETSRVKKEPGHISPAANPLLGVMKLPLSFLSCKHTYFARNTLNTP